MQQFYPKYQTESQFYAISFYWTITTITTVGYGDITGKNILEYIFSCFMMVIGVISFSYANGSLASIISNYDDQNGSYLESLDILEQAQKEY